MSSNSQFLNTWLIINWMGWGYILWPVYTASEFSFCIVNMLSSMFLKSKVFLYTNKYPRVLSCRVFKWIGSCLSLLILAFPGYWNWSCAQFPQRPSSLVLQMCLTGKAGAQALFPICTYSGCRSCQPFLPFSPWRWAMCSAHMHYFPAADRAFFVHLSLLWSSSLTVAMTCAASPDCLPVPQSLSVHCPQLSKV